MPSNHPNNRTDMLLIHLGIGHVGNAVAASLLRLMPIWQERFGIGVHYWALADSSAFVIPDGQEHALSSETVTATLEARAKGQPLATQTNSLSPSSWRDVLHQAIAVAGTPDRVIVVDSAVGAGTTPILLAARTAGAHAVLCNKDPLAGPYSQFQALRGIHTSGTLRLSATVGAGLPVTGAVAAAAASDDTRLEMSAVASGSLGQLCTAMSSGAFFPDALRSAIDAGYCEPDPRLDLSGYDVARKLLILARLAGVHVEMEDVAVESLVPPGAEAFSRDTFLTALPTWHAHLADRVAAAQDAGNVLRYVGTLSADGALHARLRELDRNDPLAIGVGPENVFVMHSARYERHPLVIAGPGAGVAVTAGSVISDIARAAGVL